jgi:hypothetical protein
MLWGAMIRRRLGAGSPSIVQAFNTVYREVGELKADDESSDDKRIARSLASRHTRLHGFDVGERFADIRHSDLTRPLWCSRSPPARRPIWLDRRHAGFHVSSRSPGRGAPARHSCALPVDGRGQTLFCANTGLACARAIVSGWRPCYRAGAVPR